MNDLLRGLAPISDAAWKEIDNEARRTLTPILAARKLVDFKGPLGWHDSGVGLGRVSALPTPPREKVTAAIRQVQALIELRAEFTLSRAEIEVIDRGGPDPDLDPVREAARRNPTRMRRWRRLDDGSRPGHAELELQRESLNEPGHAVAFAVSDIHSIEYGDDTFFIRVTGGDVETKQTLRFDVEKKTVEVADRVRGQQ